MHAHSVKYTKSAAQHEKIVGQHYIVTHSSEAKVSTLPYGGG